MNSERLVRSTCGRHGCIYELHDGRNVVHMDASWTVLPEPTMTTKTRTKKARKGVTDHG